MPCLVAFRQREWCGVYKLDMQYDEVKYGSLCSHDFHKSLTNEIELPCLEHNNLIHKISQCGKICNKCTHIIKDSVKWSQKCLVCTEKLEEYVKDRQLCQHEHPEFFDIIVKCLNDQHKNHEVPFRTKICKRCSDKLRAAFMNSKTCKVCEGKEAEVIRDMEKTYISSSYSYYKAVITILREAKAPEDVFKNQIESGCKSQPRVKRIGHSAIPPQLLAEYESADTPENHQSKRYKLYPKCRKHMEYQITVCNNCLVSLLNIDTCPFGCVEEEKAQKIKVDKQIKISETGFLHLYPLPIGETCYLELFTLKLIEQRGRMDRWESKITRVSPSSEFEVKFAKGFPLFYSSVAVTDREFLVCGGAVGPAHNRKQTNQAFVVSLSRDLNKYSIIQIKPMIQPHSGHSLVFHEQKKLVFAVGGLQQGGVFSRSSEVYSIEQETWFKIKDLNVERSKPTVSCYQGQIYVMGGLTANQAIYEAMAERFNFETESWDKVTYDGFDYPFLTNCTATTSLAPLRNKQSLFLFGGSNTENMSNLIQPVDIAGGRSDFQLNHLKTINQMRLPRINPVLGLIKEDTLICFGGLEECHSFLNVQGFTLKLTDQEVSIYAPLDDVAIGSYRLILREDSKVTYKRLQELLEAQGLINASKLSQDQERSISESHNAHLIERMWYTFGKEFVWVPL